MTVAGSKAQAVLEALARRGPIDQRVALVVAHPDDDVIALAGQMARFRRLILIHLTAGAPGADSASTTGVARMAEVEASLAAAAARPERRLCYDFPDGALVDHLPDLERRLAVDLVGAEVVLTHPFEGGHVDHDACAFAVWRACLSLARTHDSAPDRLEFASYHSRRGKVRAGEFWDDPTRPSLRIDLTPDAVERRIAALACHRSQESNLRYFYLTRESFRAAPIYDFAERPPPGATLYEAEAQARLTSKLRAVTLGTSGA